VLVKVPAPVPLELLEFAIVGFWDVLQQTPLAVTDVPPVLVILPPLVALVVPGEVIAVVVKDAKPTVVITVNCEP
jgi:hypothetical protein